jgi:hypothetical protein
MQLLALFSKTSYGNEKTIYTVFCHSGLDPESSAFFGVLNYWMPDRACPQLDWGSGMTDRN